MERVKVNTEMGMASKNGSGLCAAAFMRRLPVPPVEDDGRLHDAKMREHVIERIFSFKRWRETRVKGRTRGNLLKQQTYLNPHPLELKLRNHG
jgi:hypothetical protein